MLRQICRIDCSASNRWPTHPRKWYALDLIVTVALGSCFANGVLSNNITVVQSLVGFVILVGLQFIIAFTVVRWSVIINARPRLLF
jgi:uncharacterized membrane protein YcaP (DUF421 family)